jgi:hypothetical protein
MQGVKYKPFWKSRLIGVMTRWSNDRSRGRLIGYGFSVANRILRAANPSDLPVQAPSIHAGASVSKNRSAPCTEWKFCATSC